ncbi:MAG: putative ribonuclease VapC [Parcubacteria group bacterium GW2011_GWA1_38_7]|nr:MAG: putative ribonuclease VapC [Parcubacteria group bacterium GW2011_GWA1_38_7]
MYFVDTNIFIRFLTNDHPTKARKCFELLGNANQGKIKLQTTESVISEIVYILSSKRLYNLPRVDITQKLMPVLKISKLAIPQKRTLMKALEIYVDYKIDFEDAILIANMYRTKTKEIFTYDEGFEKIPQIKRLKP